MTTEQPRRDGAASSACSEITKSSVASTHDFARIMLPVAIEVLGEPNTALSSKTEKRFGSRGALCVDVKKGTWCDHSDGDKGGGVLDFLRAQRSLDKNAALSWLRERKHLPPSTVNGKGRIVATYDYTDAKGVLLFQVVRYDPKDFRQRRPDGNGGWVWKMQGITKVLYRLPQVLAAVRARQTVFVCEGEKAVHAMEANGFIATCSPGGAGKWKEPGYTEALTGADVIVLADLDEPGEAHAEQVLRALKRKAWRVRRLFLPHLPLKGDVADYFCAGQTADDLKAWVQESPPVGWNDIPHPFDVPADDEDAIAKPRVPEPEPAQTEQLKPDPLAAVISEFNARFMVVNEQGKAVILQPGYDPILRRRTYDRLAVRDLQTLYLNRRVQVGTDDNGRPIWKTAADLWLRHPDRRQYINGVTFDPTSTAPKPGVLNLWEGFAVKPKPGDWSKMRWHILHVLCRGVEAHADYCIKWNATLFQRPAEPGETAIVMRGVEGSGKGFVARAVGRITGQHGIAISNAKHLVGNFNAHLRDSIFLFADEAFFAGDRSHIGVLKSLITEPHLTIEGKFQNATSAPNFLHVMMASNEDWVVPASIEARRFFVLNVSPEKVGDHAYFAALHEEMESGGYEAMLHDLLTMDISGFNVRSVPTTEGLQEQRKLSLGTTEAWWVDCLERGYVFRSRLGLEQDFAKWHPKITMELLFASYIEFAQRAGERRPLSRETLGKFFTQINASASRWRNGVVGEAIVDVDHIHGGSSRKAALVKAPDRSTGYSLGTLSQARDAFVKQTGLSIEWDGGVSDAECAE